MVPEALFNPADLGLNQAGEAAACSVPAVQMHFVGACLCIGIELYMPHD